MKKQAPVRLIQATTTLVQEELKEMVTRRGQKLLDKVYLLLILDIRVLM